MYRNACVVQVYMVGTGLLGVPGVTHLYLVLYRYIWYVTGVPGVVQGYLVLYSGTLCCTSVLGIAQV